MVGLFPLLARCVVKRARLAALVALAASCATPLPAPADAPRSLAQAETLSQQSGRPILAIVGRDT